MASDPISLLDRFYDLQITVPSDHGSLKHLLPTNFKQTIRDWLEEDCPSFDYGGFVVGEDESTATLYGKAEVFTQQVVDC